VKHIALIPARGGSKSIPNKNLEQISGLSLVKIAWNQCLSTNFFDQVILSTDSKEIAKEVWQDGDFENLPIESFTRFDKLGYIHKRSTLDSGDSSIVSHLLFKLASRLNADLVWLIQPTSPFRLKREFLDLKKITEDVGEWSSIVSVKDARSIHPHRMYFMKDFLIPVTSGGLVDSLPRQSLNPVYIRDGAFYILRKTNLENNIFLGEKITPYFRNPNLNVNIDNIEDLKFAQFLASSQKIFFNEN
jgi:CMP-N,N'-diacetyllegionaminic acid synthase